MKPFSRLRDEEGTDVERLLLGSAESDAPSHAAKTSALAALGLAGATAAASGTAHAASAAVLGGAGGKVATTATGLTLVKWLVVGAAVGAATTGSVVVATSPGMFGEKASTPAVQAPRALPAAPVRRATTETSGAAHSAPESEPVEQGLQAREPTVPRARSLPDEAPGPGLAPSPQGTSFPATAETVAAEVAALDRARGALAAGNGAGALAGLDAYEKRYPAGTLAPEAAVLRVRTLLQLGRTRDARAAVDAFVRTHPGSSQASRLRALVGE